MTLSKCEAAESAFRAGDYQRAVEFQLAWLSEIGGQQADEAEGRKALARYLFAYGDFEGALSLLEQLTEQGTGDSDVPVLLGSMLRRSGKVRQAIERLSRALREDSRDFRICDELNACHLALKQLKEAVEFGRRALELRDAATATVVPPEAFRVAAPEFDETNREANIISFALFGHQLRHWNGALRNARLACDLYPSWTCRFYCDEEVPRSLVRELKGLGCQVMVEPSPASPEEGLLWRLAVLDDPTVARFLIRDCDAYLSVRERVAVDQWLESGKWFHVMRDHPAQTELLPGGLWGGAGGVLKGCLGQIEEVSPSSPSRSVESLLRERVWPLVRESVLIHDSVFTGCLGGIDFPSVARLPAGCHVGQRMTAAVEREPGADLSPGRSGRFFVFGYDSAEIGFARQVLDAHPQVDCPAEHHVSTVWRDLGTLVHNYSRLIDPQGERNVPAARVREELYTTWLDCFFTTYSRETVTHIGISDSDLDVRLDFHGEICPGAKFLFVIRDPRDVAVAIFEARKSIGQGGAAAAIEEIASEVGVEWVEKLNRIQAFNGSYPGRVELMRFEDLLCSETRSATISRVLKFLGLPVSRPILEDLSDHCMHLAEKDFDPSRPDWRDVLSVAQVQKIQQEAASLMSLFRYEIWPVDGAALGRGESLMPS